MSPLQGLQILGGRSPRVTLVGLAHPGLSCVVAAHLSERNNTPELAREHLSQALKCSPHEIEVATPDSGTVWFKV